MSEFKCDGCSDSVDTMTAVVAISIVLCVMMLFASGKTGIFSVITSVFGCLS